MEKILELVFKNEDGDTNVVTVVDPREDITAEEAHEAMEIINKCIETYKDVFRK